MSEPPASLRDRLRAELRTAMKRRDRAAAALYRSTLAAIDNAEAPPVGEHRAGAVEGSPVGPGAAEVMRRALTEDDVVAVVRREAAERREVAQVLAVTNLAAAADLRHDADTLDRLVNR